MANLLLLQFSTSSSSSSSSTLFGIPSRRYCLRSMDRLPWQEVVSGGSLECHSTGGGRFRFQPEEELRRRGGFDPFEFGKSENKRMWWSDFDDNYEDNDDGELLPMVFEGLQLSVTEDQATLDKKKNMAGVNPGGYKSWVVGDADPRSTDSRYGGWDDLDTQKEIIYASGNPPSENGRLKLLYKRKVVRPWRVKEKPLLPRMLFAVFPFLGVWTKLL